MSSDPAEEQDTSIILSSNRSTTKSLPNAHLTTMLSKAARSMATSRLCFSKGHLSASHALQIGQEWKGSDSKQHVTEKSDTLNVQAVTSKEWQDSKAKGSLESSATSEKDIGKSNARAKKDTTAPGPVIGMNDERGAVGPCRLGLQ